jgi:hypothetical protein
MKEWEWVVVVIRGEREWRGGVVSVVRSEGERMGVVVVIGDGK